MLTDQDLTAEQRAWAPRHQVEARALWRAVTKVGLAAGVLVYLADEHRFDWRIVAVAADAFPGWRIRLYNARTLVAYLPAPDSPTIPASTDPAIIGALDRTDAAALRADHAAAVKERMVVAAERWIVFAQQRGINPLVFRIEDLHVAARLLADSGAPQHEVLDLIEQVGSMAGLLFTDEWTRLRRIHDDSKCVGPSEPGEGDASVD